MTSPSRKQVLEALEIVGAAGATRDELVDLIGNISRHSVGMTLSSCRTDNLIESPDGFRWFLRDVLTKRTPNQKAIQASVSPYSNGSHRIELPEIAKDRKAHTVAVYTSPIEEVEIVQVQMLIGNSWMKLPLFGDLRICTGPDIPRWSEDQESNINVQAVRLVRRNGTFHDIDVPRGYPVTISYQE